MDNNTHNKTIGYFASQYRNDPIAVDRDTDGLDAICRMLDGYIDRVKNSWQPEWYVKNAAIYFTYDGKYYVVYPARLHTSSEIFERFANSVIDDLFALGAYDIFYSGMLD